MLQKLNKTNWLIHISIFNEDFEIVKNIVGLKIDVSQNEWLIHNAEIFENNENKRFKIIN